MISKMEIVSRHAINIKKFKTSATKRLKDLEEHQHHNVTQTQFNESLNAAEQRILNYLRENMEKFESQLSR